MLSDRVTKNQFTPNPLTKQFWREILLAQRLRRSPAERAIAATELLATVDNFVQSLGANTVAGYAPDATEPGTLEMWNHLRAKGIEVMLPIVQPGPAAPLFWGRYTGESALRRGRFGLLEPATPAMADIELYLVPALAVDFQGTRLGRGAGFYDRTLATQSAPAAHPVPTAALVFSDELVAQLPSESTDVAVQWALTPQRIVELGKPAREDDLANLF